MRIILFFTALILLTNDSIAQNNTWIDKIDTRLLEQISTGEEPDFLIVMQQQADVRPAAQYKHKADKGQFVYETCTTLAEATQGRVRQLLTEAHAPMRTHWIINAVWGQGNMDLMEELAKLPEVARISNNPVVHREELPIMSSDATAVHDRAALSWGIDKIQANKVWWMGYRGQGVVVGGQDTGYEWQHPALLPQYRGWDGATADHNYNWHDAIRVEITPTANSCGLDLQAPCDDNGHGTHTMGTMVGQALPDSIGVAPEAQWIGCRNMEEGDGTPETYIECFEWFILPKNLAGMNGDATKAPHVINNSWGCPTSEGCNTGNFSAMNNVINNVRAAGILPVVSAGNSGSGCATVNTPAAIFQGSFSVGATNSSDVIAGFSSRGPVTVDGSNRRKPDISAPGVGITSSLGYDHGNYGYATYNGTSMAGPHVAGLVALLMSANPLLKDDIDLVQTIIQNYAVELKPTVTTGFCGGDDANSTPNHTYGHGRINALAAVNQALALPVELLYFKANNEQKQVSLSWATGSEVNSKVFEIERSPDAFHWQVVGSVSAQGHSTQTSSYRFYDTKPLSGKSYYRLRQVDFSGAAMHSVISMVTRKGVGIDFSITVHTPSATAWINMEGTEPESGWFFELRAMDGRLLQQWDATQESALALPFMTTGLYIVYLKDDQNRILNIEKLWWP